MMADGQVSVVCGNGQDCKGKYIINQKYLFCQVVAWFWIDVLRKCPFADDHSGLCTKCFYRSINFIWSRFDFFIPKSNLQIECSNIHWSGLSLLLVHTEILNALRWSLKCSVSSLSVLLTHINGVMLVQLQNMFKVEWWSSSLK